MGVKGLSKLLSEFCKIEYSLEFMKDSRVAIDTSIFLYRYKYGSNDDTDVFLKKFEAQIKNFERYNITPIYVFDGKPPIQKAETLKKRNLTREKAKKIADDETDIEKANNIRKNIIYITSDDTQNVKNLFDKMGIKYVCPDFTEGEKYCAFMNKNGLVDFVLSNDYDTVVFGCSKLVNTINDSCYKTFDTENILINLGIKKEDLVDLCISCGTDYFPQGIPKMGPKKSLAFIKRYGRIENWGIEIPEDLNLQDLRRIFLDDPPPYE